MVFNLKQTINIKFDIGELLNKNLQNSNGISILTFLENPNFFFIRTKLLYQLNKKSFSNWDKLFKLQYIYIFLIILKKKFYLKASSSSSSSCFAI